MPIPASIRGAAVATLLALTFAACGSDSDSADAVAAAGSKDSHSASSASASASSAAEGSAAAEESSADAGSDSVSHSDAAPAEGGDVTVLTVTSGDDAEVTVPFKPETVVVLDYAVLETLAYLDVDVAGVPKHLLNDALAVYNGDSTADIGTLFEPDFEAIAALEPDLIIAGGRSSAVVPDLAEIANTIDLTNRWGSEFGASFETNVLALGQIFGKEAEAEAAVADINDQAAAVKAKSADAGTALILLTTGGEVSAYGPGSRFDLIHNELGFAPATDSLTAETHGDAVSFEFIAEANPSYIFVLDRDAAIGAEGASAQEILDNPLVADTDAGKNGNIIYLDTPSWYLTFGGIGSVERAIAEVGAGL